MMVHLKCLVCYWFVRHTERDVHPGKVNGKYGQVMFGRVQSIELGIIFGSDCYECLTVPPLAVPTLFQVNELIVATWNVDKMQ